MEEESSCFPLCSGFLLWQTTAARSDLVRDLKAKELLSELTLQFPAGQQWLTHQGNTVTVPASLWFQVWWEREQFFQVHFKIYCSRLAHLKVF